MLVGDDVLGVPFSILGAALLKNSLNTVLDNIIIYVKI